MKYQHFLNGQVLEDVYLGDQSKKKQKQKSEDWKYQADGYLWWEGGVVMTMGAYKRGAEQVLFLNQGSYKGVHLIIICLSICLFGLVFWIFDFFTIKICFKKALKRPWLDGSVD